MKKIVFLLCFFVFMLLEYSSSLPINNTLDFFGNWQAGFIIPSFDTRLPAVVMKYYELVLIITGMILLFVVIFRVFNHHVTRSIKPWKKHCLPSDLAIGAIVLLQSPLLRKHTLLAIVVDMHQRNLLKREPYGAFTKGDKQANLPWEVMLQNGNYSDLATEIPEAIGHFFKKRGILNHNPVVRWKKEKEKLLWLKRFSALFLIMGCTGVIGWEPFGIYFILVFLGGAWFYILFHAFYYFLYPIIKWITKLFFTTEVVDKISSVISSLLLILIPVFYLFLIYEQSDFFRTLFIILYMFFLWLYISLLLPEQYQFTYLEGKIEDYYAHDFTKTPTFEQHLPYVLAFNLIPNIDVSDAYEWAAVEQYPLINSQWKSTEQMHNYLYAIGEAFGYADNRHFIPPTS